MWASNLRVAQIVGTWERRVFFSSRSLITAFIAIIKNTLSKEIILNEVRFRESPTITFALPPKVASCFAAPCMCGGQPLLLQRRPSFYWRYPVIL